MTRQERQLLKMKAQDSCLRGIANIVLGEVESYGETDRDLVREIGKQAQIIMRKFDVVGFHGLPDVDQNLDEWVDGLGINDNGELK